jgi:hypothetical protein
MADNGIGFWFVFGNYHLLDNISHINSNLGMRLGLSRKGGIVGNTKVEGVDWQVVVTDRNQKHLKHFLLDELCRGAHPPGGFSCRDHTGNCSKEAKEHVATSSCSSGGCLL